MLMSFCLTNYKAMNTLPKFLVVFSALLIVFLSAAFKVQAPASAEKVNWVSIEEAEKLSKKNPRKIFVDVYTDWCGWCKRMDANTFSHPAVAKYLNEKFYSVKFNAEMTGNVIFKDRVYKYSDQYRSNELAVTMLGGKMSYPTVVYLDEKLNVIQPVPGYVDAAEFDKIIHFFGENQHTKMGYEEFQKTYKPRF
jgi:thioredoxin-related protein